VRLCLPLCEFTRVRSTLQLLSDITLPGYLNLAPSSSATSTSTTTSTPTPITTYAPTATAPPIPNHLQPRRSSRSQRPGNKMPRRYRRPQRKRNNVLTSPQPYRSPHISDLATLNALFDEDRQRWEAIMENGDGLITQELADTLDKLTIEEIDRVPLYVLGIPDLKHPQRQRLASSQAQKSTPSGKSYATGSTRTTL